MRKLGKLSIYLEERVVDKRKSSDYQELRGFIPKTLSMDFKAACKKAGQNINETLEEAVQDWIAKQEKLTPPTQGNLERGNFLVATLTDHISQDSDAILATLPTLATAIEKTLQNPEWGLKHLAKETKISVSRLKKLLSGERPSDEEIENLSGFLIGLNGQAFEEEELSDMRLAEDLRQRQLRRAKERQTSERPQEKK